MRKKHNLKVIGCYISIDHAAIEGAESTVIMACGMCTITTMLLALIPSGGHIITTSQCYRNARIFIETVLPKMNITCLYHKINK